MASPLQHGQRVSGAEARAAAAAGRAGARGAAGARAGGPHARGRRARRAHAPGRAARTPAAGADRLADALLRLQGDQVCFVKNGGLIECLLIC